MKRIVIENMASWVTHLRIADRLLDRFTFLPKKNFIVGNIAPDSGVPNKNGDEFEPPTYISHWKLEGIPRSERAEKFKERYLTHSIDTNKFAFYLGYYVHLLTDYIWVRDIYPELQNKYPDEFENNPDFFIKVKQDMFEIDYLYLKKHMDFRAFMIFKDINEFPNIYLDYFSELTIQKKIAYIVNYYEGFSGKMSKSFLYIHECQVDTFVYKATEEIELKLKEFLRGD